MEDFHGVLRADEITASSGAGGNTYCNIQPPEGEIWKLYSLVAMQNDQALTMNMGWCDVIGSHILSMYTEANVAASQLEDFFANIKANGPMWCNRDCYPYVYFAGMAASKTITCRVVYERVVGVPTMNGA